MKLYLTVGTKDEGSEKFQNWTGTQAAARADRVLLRKSGFKEKDIYSYEEDVPTDKPGLLGFLNAHNVGPKPL